MRPVDLKYLRKALDAERVYSSELHKHARRAQHALDNYNPEAAEGLRHSFEKGNTRYLEDQQALAKQHADEVDRIEKASTIFLLIALLGVTGLGLVLMEGLKWFGYVQ